MPPETTLAELGREQLSQWFDELRGIDDDFAQFVAQQLDQLQALARAVDEREHELSVQAERVDRQLEALAESQQRLDRASAAAEKWTNMLPEMTSPAPASIPQELVDLLGEMRQLQKQIGEDFSLVKSDAMAMANSAVADFAQARAELLTMSADLQQVRTSLAEAAATVAAMPARMVSVAPVAAPNPVAPAIASNERPTADAPLEQSGGWQEELASLRRGLSQAENRGDKPAVRAQPAAPGTLNGDDSSLSSLMEQFQSLQSELHARREVQPPKLPVK